MVEQTNEVTAAACRYLLAALLPRLERFHPGLVAELRSGIEADRAAMAVNGTLSPQVGSVFGEALRVLELSGAK